MTLLQCIQGLIDNISVTDKQEENIKASLSNLEGHLLDKDNGLHILRTFTNGSYDRDTIIRPLNDVDVFAVLDYDKWKDEYGNLPNPQSVLTKFRNYLNDQNDYKDKVKQDRPCVTVQLSDKDFDVLPSFAQLGGGYLIPNYDLESWTFSYPEQLTNNLDDIHKKRGYKVKPTIMSVKYWNRENNKLIPSYHIEEVAINIFQLNDFKNFEQSIRLWFNNAETYLDSSKFKSNDEYTKAINKVRRVKDKLNDALKKYEDNKEDEAIQIWKDIFGKEFPTVSDDEAKNFSKSLSEGNLKISPSGALSTTVGTAISASKGYFGDISKA
ncbi:nucleotidyltransferase [Lacibacter luteus]|uniref:Nucleotidyltransferase n=1 Tax=Lacibacter luteus TaxID=2508719 RepID=A0A4Q1CGE2_9BACT|nr:nucleotidyltransferase [Lacibacter luteus]RXK59205.1 nucleotidyltransferase [Lacibacter luteus]